MLPKAYIQTGQITCHDVSGLEIPCQGCAQDADFAKGCAMACASICAG